MGERSDRTYEGDSRWFDKDKITRRTFNTPITESERAESLARTAENMKQNLGEMLSAAAYVNDEKGEWVILQKTTDLSRHQSYLSKLQTAGYIGDRRKSEIIKGENQEKTYVVSVTPAVFLRMVDRSGKTECLSVIPSERLTELQAQGLKPSGQSGGITPG